VIRFAVFGKLASMKNRRVPLKQNPYKTIPNAECRAFERDFALQVPRAAKQAIGSVKRLLRAKVTVFYPSMRSDLDCAFLYDLLQKNGVVRNDRYIRKKEELALIDKANPRVEIEVDYL
jgi:Holliday junction resolvase RusA-like endonuclease